MFRVTVESSGVWISTDLPVASDVAAGRPPNGPSTAEDLVKISSLGALSYGQMERPTIVRSMKVDS
jgi:hypothetical protein